MNLAILHYHLNRGGVARVIENHLLALDAVLSRDRPLRVALVYGGRQMGWPEDFAQRLRAIRLSIHAVPALEYDAERPAGPPQPSVLGEQLLELLRELEFSPQETLLHVHNHALGKNVDLPPALWDLAEQGYALLLHVHDFAEDFRPGNFRRLAAAAAAGGEIGDCWHGRLYPQAAHVHYAVLTGRDRGVLEAAGTPPERLHHLPNPVPGPEDLPPREHARRRLAERFGVGPDERFVLYPVRCIRRKNVGETLLYSLLSPPGCAFGLTLPPLNPAEKPVYERWREVAGELGLPCRFDVGAEGGLTFGENLAACDQVLTTSVAEGFGMAFLEPWLAGRGLVGRDLPEITADFKQAGVRLGGLRARLDVPAQWLDLDHLRHAILEAYRLTLAVYDRPEPADFEHALKEKAGGELIDFADLDESLQERVIERAWRGACDRREIVRRNGWLEQAFARSAHEGALVSRNAAAIGRHYSLAISGRRLLRAYERALASPRGGPLQPLPQAGRILDAFLDLARFRLIRSERGIPSSQPER